MRTITFALASAAAFAQNTPHIRDWKPPSSEHPARPARSCVALKSLTNYDFSVISAEAIAASKDAPEFCRVLLQVMPEIRIEVALPAAWHRRLCMFGNGGFAGEDLEAPNRVAHRNAALRSGFAVTQTNTGHDAKMEPGASFAVNSQKLLDYSFRSLHVTAETAKRVVEGYYRRRPAKSYYNGCSTGGRQGFQFAQLYPDDFDGIVAGAPALNSLANRLRGVSNAKHFAGGILPAAKLELLATRVYAKCDAIDGASDGLIEDPGRCDLQPARDLPECPAGEGPACFTPAQLKAIESVYSDITVDGKMLAPAFPKGAEIAGPNGKSGWDGWILRDGALGQGPFLTESALKFLAFPDRTGDQWRQFDFARDTQALAKAMALMSATDPDLSRFRDRGGKLLVYFGWADPALNPLLAVDYYEKVTALLGPSTGQFFRLYMMPGVFHCSGGVGTACFDPLVQVIPWVEEGKAPGAILAQRMEGGKVLRTRPLCAYPEVARYKGQGSLDEAASFRCEAPAK